MKLFSWVTWVGLFFFQWYHEDHEEFRDAKIIFEVRVGVMEVVGCWEA